MLVLIKMINRIDFDDDIIQYNWLINSYNTIWKGNSYLKWDYLWNKKSKCVVLTIVVCILVLNIIN